MKDIISFALVILLFSSSSVSAQPLYGKPEFRGRIIDAQTKEPVEGAVAVVLYYKQPLVGSPGGPNSYVFEAKETLTDNKGEFYFPSLTSLSLFTKDSGIRFIFYKPGYMAGYGPESLDASLIQKYFETDVVGKEAQIHNDRGRPASYKGPLGIVELKRAKTYEERRKTRPNIAGIDEHKLPLFFKIVEDEYRYLYGIKEGS